MKTGRPKTYVVSDKPPGHKFVLCGYGKFVIVSEGGYAIAALDKGVHSYLAFAARTPAERELALVRERIPSAELWVKP